MAITRADVARRAGVSPAVVSYVLNGGPRPVSDEARERVLAAVSELGYRPNSIARSLRMSSTRTLGLVVPDNANPFFAELSHAIENAAYERGYMLLLGNALGDAVRQVRYVKTFIDQQVEGLAIIPSHDLDSDCLDEVKAARTPLVVVDRDLASTTVSSVLLDNASGAEQAVNHLIDDHGRRKVGCLAGPVALPPAQQRVEGWRRALAARGLRDGSHVLFRSDFDRSQARAVASQMLSKTDVDAVFVTSDEQAVGLLRAAADLGIRVPQDVAVMSFDGIPAGHYTVPSLSTMEQPFSRIGQTVVELLVDAGQVTERRRLEVSPRFGESCGCVARRGA